MNLGNELYFLHPYINNSRLSQFSGKYKPDFIDAYAVGALLDAMLTTPELVDFYKLRIIGYDFQFTEDQFDICKRMRNACRSHPELIKLIRICQGQEEFYTSGVNFEYDGLSFQLNCKIKYDLWSYQLGWGADIKTTTAKSYEEFIQQAYYFDYDQQRAFYMLNSGAKKDILIGVSKSFPFRIFFHYINYGDPFFKSGIQKVNKNAYALLCHTGRSQG